MGTLHKRTHRPLARALPLLALFAVLGVVGWNLPQVGSAALAYSTNAVQIIKAAGTALSSFSGASAAPAVPKDKAEKKAEPISAPAAAKAAVAAATTTLADTPGQQAVATARAQLATANANAKANPTKANVQARDAAYANFYAAAAIRIAEIKAKLNASPALGDSKTDSGGGLPADYDALVNELKELSGIPISNAPAANNTSEVEPNNTSATATNIGDLSGQTMRIGNGAITPAGDVDFWAVTVPANSKVWAFIDTGGSTTSRDSVMDLLDTNGTTVLESDDDGATATNCTTTVISTAASAIGGKTLTAAGTYFLRVAAFSGTATISSYKLFVVVTTTSSAEVEPNNTSALADSITPANGNAGRVRTGAIGVAGDVDFYSVAATAGSLININADCDPERDATSTDIVVDVIDTNGTTVLLSIDGTPALFGVAPDSEASCVTAPATGTYFVRVRHFSATGTGSYALMVSLGSPAAVAVCPPTPITSSLGVAGGNFAKVSGVMTQRLNRDGVQSACGVPRTQAAPIAATRTFDKYTLTNSGAAACVFVQLKVIEQAASNYQIGAFSAFVPTNLTSGWLGDAGLSSGIPPTITSFSVNIGANATFDVVVFNSNATGDGNAYELTVLGLSGCAPPPPCVLTCPANITVSNAANQCGATVTYPAPTTSGACSTVTCSPASGSFFPKGVTTVTCTGTSFGAQPPSTCSFTVTVNDTQPPTFNPNPPPDVFVGTSGATTVVNYALPTVTDNCPGPQPPVCVPASGSSFPVGVTTVTCTAKDASNNTATTSFKVTVNRVAPPTFTDPLACTGPGNLLTVQFSITNNGAVSQTVAVNAFMPRFPNRELQLFALPGTSTATIGSATVVNAGTVTYAGTLAGGQTATITFQAQVSDVAVSGSQLTVTLNVSFNGGPFAVITGSTTVNCLPVTVGGLIPSSSAVSDQKAGSVLIYPIYTSTVGSVTQNTRVSVTNINPQLASNLHVFFVADNCQVSDAFLCLTPNQTTTFLMSDLDPGTTGYIVMVAVDRVNGCPTNFNFLIGDEYVKFSSGHAANLAAESISAIAGGLPFCNANSVTSTLRFDDVSYNALPTTLQLDNIGSRADGNDTILVVNRIGGDLRVGPLGLGNLFGVLYDDAEASVSWTLNSSSCQLRTTINNSTPRTTPRFEQFIQAGRTGWMRIWHRDNNAILGAAINFNANAAASSGAFNQGHNLHKSTFTQTANFIIPVFPPVCIN